jgi:molecular chaperone DnaK
MLRENGDRIPAREREDLEAAAGRLRDALKSEDTGAIQSAGGRVNQAAQRAGEALYRAASGSGAFQMPHSTADMHSSAHGSRRGGPVDADFTVVKDE